MTIQLQKPENKPSEVQEREDKKQAEFEAEMNSVEFGGVHSSARYDFEEFKDGLKFLLSHCLTEGGKLDMSPDIKLTLGRSSRLPVQLTNTLLVEDAFLRLKPHLRLVVLQRFVYHKRFKAMEKDLNYKRVTLDRHLNEALREMFRVICND